jgi:uncharacterized lipoprotein YddW (UPF0748 family)
MPISALTRSLTSYLQRLRWPQSWLVVASIAILSLASFWYLWPSASPTGITTQRTQSAPSAPIVKEPAEIRGVWITNVASSILFSPWGIPRAFHQLANMHFNTVYPVVWNRGNTFYRSAALQKIGGRPIDPLVAFTHPREDPLSEMVRLGHRQHLRIVPWFEYGFMVPLNSQLARQHPNWLTCRQNGSQQLRADTFDPPEAIAPKQETAKDSRKNVPKAAWRDNLLKSGAPSQLGWLNPLHPSVQGLILAMAEEVVNQYDIDGIQFDDHFSLPVEFGYDAYTLSLYQAEHQGQAPPNNPADQDWIRWRADKLSKFINVLHAHIKAKCPSCILSLSPNPAKFAYRFYLQDWRTWVRQGWLDELVVQVYRDNLSQFEDELSKAALSEARDRIPVSIGILTGTWRRPISFEQIQAQVNISRDHRFSGISFFYWDTLWSYFTPEAPAQRRRNFQRLLSGID